MGPDKKQNPGGGEKDLPEKPKRPSGAARRKLSKLRGREARRTGTRAGTRADAASASGTAHAQCSGPQRTQGAKRARSDGSTPKRPTKRSKGVEYARSFKSAVTDIPLAIVPEGYPYTALDEEQAGLTKASLLQVIVGLQAGEPAPRFSEMRSRGGALIMACADQVTAAWLERVVPTCTPWAEAKLRVIDPKLVQKPVRALAFFPGTPQLEPESVLKCLERQNPGLLAETWKVVDRKLEPKGQQLIVLMGKVSWEKIVGLDNRPYFAFSRVLFKALGRKKGEGDPMEEEMGEAPEQPEVPPPTTGSEDAGGEKEDPKE